MLAIDDWKWKWMKQQLDMTDEEFSEEIEWNGGCVKERQVEDEKKEFRSRRNCIFVVEIREAVNNY